MAKQMYKIFINQNFILFTNKKPPTHIFKNDNIKQDEKKVKEVVNLIQNGLLAENHILYANNFKNLYKKLKSQFDFIKAAGGIVFNQHDEFLAIYRMGKWDFPKGKLKKSEKIKSCAKREVEEETGVKNLEILHKISSTYHIFLSANNKWALKKTHWYKMKNTKECKLIPFTYENIERCEWFPKERLNEFTKNTYPSIKELIINASS